MVEHILFSYRDALKNRNRLEAKLEIVRNDLMPKSPLISDMPKGQNDGDKMADYVARVDEILKELMKAYEKTLEEYQRIDSIISSVDDARLRDLLTYRYIRGYKWECIADAMYLSRMQIYRLKNQALDAVKKILDDNK